MDQLDLAIREMQEEARFAFERRSEKSMRVEGLDIEIEAMKNRYVYTFGSRPNMKRHFTLEDALEALADYVAKVVAKR